MSGNGRLVRIRCMNNFEDDNLPPELGDVARQLRNNRHEATPLELDQTKRRVLGRAASTGARARRFGWLRKPAFVTATIGALSLGAGSAGAFSIPFFHLPFFVHHVVAPAAAPAAAPIGGLGGFLGGILPIPSASGFQYNPFLQFLQALLKFILHLLGLG